MKKNVINILFTALIIIILFTAYKHFSKPRTKTIIDKTAYFSEINEVIRREMVKIGITDYDIISSTTEIKKSNDVIWRRLKEEVIVRKEISFNDWENEIKSSLEYIDAGIYGTVVDRKNNKITFEIGRDGLVMAAITLRHGLQVKGRAAIILDDLGNQKDIVEKYLKLKLPLTYAILPQAPFSTYLAKKIKESGYDALLHLPCEPESYPETNPGAGAIFVSMDAGQIKKTIMADLATVPQVIGASNHEGSRAMSDEKTVREILRVLKSLNLVFIDSKTTPKSKVKETAKGINIKTIENDVFLDNRNDYKYIAGQMEKLINIAKKTRKAIAIGHIHNKETFKVISDYVPKFKKAGIEIVGVSELLK